MTQSDCSRCDHLTEVEKGYWGSMEEPPSPSIYGCGHPDREKFFLSLLPASDSRIIEGEELNPVDGLDFEVVEGMAHCPHWEEAPPPYEPDPEDMEGWPLSTIFPWSDPPNPSDRLA